MLHIFLNNFTAFSLFKLMAYLSVVFKTTVRRQQDIFQINSWGMQMMQRCLETYNPITDKNENSYF